MNLVRRLAVHRYAVYAGGLAVIIAPAVLADAGVTVPRRLRAAVVAVTLAVMVVTYLGERRLRSERDGTATPGPVDPTDQPSLQARLGVAGALVGLAVGGYLAIQGRLWVGGLFVGGAALFGRMAVARSVGGESA